MKRGFASLSASAMVLAAVAAVPFMASAEERGRPAPADQEWEAVDAVTPTNLERPDDGLGKGDERRTYLVRFVDEPAPAYEGGKAGFRAEEVNGDGAFDASDPAARAYTAQLEAEQAGFVSRYESRFDRQIDVPFTYQLAVNGIAAELTPDEARVMARDPNVADVMLDFERELHTDRGPGWIGVVAYDDPAPPPGTVPFFTPSLPGDALGEGVIVGIIDTGINPSNPSFLDPGEDGYDHINPLGPDTYVGVCNPAENSYDPDFPCNDKLIGAWGFVTELDENALDYDGHGSHTASTAAGNVVAPATINPASAPSQVNFNISGVAPHANIISYLGCCTASALVAAIDQAIADGVDVINYSIGSDSPTGDLYTDFDTIGFLNARKAGIFVATSNGNNGPGFATTGSPADAPWITSVGASTHDRANVNALVNLTSDSDPLGDITGRSTTGSLASTPMVYAGDFDNPLCLAPDDEEWDGEPDNTANFTDKIVVCDRGALGRVKKSINVENEGALGFVLVNDSFSGDSLNGDAYAIPGVHVTHNDGVALKNWMASNPKPHGANAGTTFDVDAILGDHVAAFSSRGPNRVADVIVPDVTAPGVDILAAAGIGNTGPGQGGKDYTVVEWDFISGTSMASPHVAGAGALLQQLFGSDWTPAEMQSALMMTAMPNLTDLDGTAATPYVVGAGRIDVARAAATGFVMDENNYLADVGSDERDFSVLNLPSFNHQDCSHPCTWQRTARSVVDHEVRWKASAVSDAGMTLATDAPSYVVPAGEEFVFTVVADLLGAPAGHTLFGRVTFTPDDNTIPTVTMPVAVVWNGLAAAFTVDPTEPFAGQRVTFDGTASVAPDGEGLTYAWDFGDDGLAEGPTPTHVFKAAGVYDVALTVTSDVTGETATTTQPVLVAERPPTTPPEEPTEAPTEGPTDAPTEEPGDPIGTGAPTGDAVEVADGTDREETAIKLSQIGWESTDEVVLAHSRNFPDALAAQVLAAQVDAPVLQNPQGVLRPEVLAEIQRLGSSTVYMMGGTAALSQEVEDALTDEGLTVVRVAGADRAETAAAAARLIAELSGQPPSEVVLGLGYDKPDGGDGWVDVLGAGTLGTVAGAPILLTSFTTLPQMTLDTINDLLPEDGTVYIVGGTAAVPQQIEDLVAVDGHAVQRLAGVDRYETMVAVVNEAIEHGAGLTPAVIASGRNFPDALSAGAVAWKLGGFLGLVDPNDLSTSAASEAFLAANVDKIDGVIVAGGSAAVSELVVSQVQATIAGEGNVPG